VRLPTTGAWFGSTANRVKSGDEYGKDAVVAFEDLIGRKIAVRRVYHLWSDVFPDSQDEWMRDRGTTLIMSWQTTTDGVPDVYWRDISAGRYDNVIDARAADIKAFGAPLFFIFDHEPEVKKLSGTAQQFVAAWRHIHDRFEADGVTNVSWVLTLLSYTYQSDTVDSWYPGDDYVDLLGADGYNWFLCPPDVWKEFTDLFQDFYDYGTAKGKPMIIPEYGSIEDAGVPGHKAQWFTRAAATLKAMPQIKAISYYNNGISHGANCDWWVDTSNSSLGAYVAMGADPYFNPPPPLVMIDAGPAEVDNHTRVTFAFHTNIPGSTYTCSLDGSPASACISPYTTSSLTDGDHTLKITATDPVSRRSSSDLETWTTDTTPPTVTITSGPSDPTQSDKATFRFTASELGTTFSCRLDSGAWQACTNPKTYNGISVGTHTFFIYGTDPAGNVGRTVTYRWTRTG
jgi:hypothetical protein